LDGQLEGSHVRRWEGIAVGVKGKKWKGVSQRLFLGLLFFIFFRFFNLCFVCLYDVHLSPDVRILLFFFLAPDTGY